jgi:hypothetical protein
MLQVYNKPALIQLRIAGQVTSIIRLLPGHQRTAASPNLTGCSSPSLFNQGIQVIRMLKTRPGGGELLLARQLGLPHDITQGLPLLLHEDGDTAPAGLSFTAIAAVGGGLSPFGPVSRGFRLSAVDGQVQQRRAKRAAGGLELRNIDVCALPWVIPAPQRGKAASTA